MLKMFNAIPDLEKAIEECRQASREIYYAMTYLPPGHKARPNLEQALKCLGIRGPKDVGLSDSVLTRDGWTTE